MRKLLFIFLFVWLLPVRTALAQSDMPAVGAETVTPVGSETAEPVEYTGPVAIFEPQIQKTPILSVSSAKDMNWDLLMGDANTAFGINMSTMPLLRDYHLDDIEIRLHLLRLNF